MYLTNSVGSPGDRMLPQQQGHVRRTVQFITAVSENLDSHMCIADPAD